MAVEVRIVIPRATLERLGGALGRLPATLAIRLRRQLEVAAARFASFYTAKRLSGRPGLKRRTGGLARALDWEATGETLTDLNARIFFRGSGPGGPLRLVWAHEHGATIRPRRRQWLTVPLPEALTAAGVPRRSSARAWENTFVQRSRRGNLLIFQKRGRGIVPLYVLRKSVEIPARLDFRQLGRQRFVPLALARMQRAVNRTLEEVASTLRSA